MATRTHAEAFGEGDDVAAKRRRVSDGARSRSRSPRDLSIKVPGESDRVGSTRSLSRGRDIPTTNSKQSVRDRTTSKSSQVSTAAGSGLAPVQQQAQSWGFEQTNQPGPGGRTTLRHVRRYSSAPVGRQLSFAQSPRLSPLFNASHPDASQLQTLYKEGGDFKLDGDGDDAAVAPESPGSPGGGGTTPATRTPGTPRSSPGTPGTPPAGDPAGSRRHSSKSNPDQGSKSNPTTPTSPNWDTNPKNRIKVNDPKRQQMRDALFCKNGGIPFKWAVPGYCLPGSGRGCTPGSVYLRGV